MSPTAKRGGKPYVFQSPWMQRAMAVFDFFGALVTWVVTAGGLKASPKVWQDPKHILVLRLDHLGDLLFSRPTLEALRLAYPKARITLMLSPMTAEIMRLDPAIDDLLIWEAPWFSRGGQAVRQAGYWGLIKALRGLNLDLSLDLRGDLRHHILLSLAKVKCRAGHTITGGRFLLHQPVVLRPGVHEVERNLDVLRSLGHKAQPVSYPPLALTREELDQGRQTWGKAKYRVVIHAGAGDPRKCWPGDYFHQLLEGLSQRGCAMVLVGSAKEKAGIDTLAAGHGDIKTLRNLCGQTSLRGLAALITNAHLFIGHDSGPAHMAVTQGINTIMLWSQTNAPEEWGPWGEQARAVVIQKDAVEATVAQILATADDMLKPFKTTKS